MAYLKPRKFARRPPRTGPAAILKFRTKNIVGDELSLQSERRLTSLVETYEATSLGWRGDVLDNTVAYES